MAERLSVLLTGRALLPRNIIFLLLVLISVRRASAARRNKKLTSSVAWVRKLTITAERSPTFADVWVSRSKSDGYRCSQRVEGFRGRLAHRIKSYHSVKSSHPSSVFWWCFLSSSCLLLTVWTGPNRLASRSQSYFTTDVQSVTISWCRAPLWGLMTRMYFLLSFAGKLLCSSFWGALCRQAAVATSV
jgi:hypothetical protein